MAVTYGFFNSVNGDRKYNADQMSEYFRGIVNQGVFQHLDGGLQVTAGTGLAVNVAAGRAIIQNRWVQNSASLPLSISAASEAYGRKDAVVLRLNISARTVTIAVKTGTPAASPTAPAMTRDATTYEMALAYVNVSAGASSVTVTDKRSDTTVCGWATVAQQTSGEVDAMLNAMKTGFDGVSYPSPVEMVQGEDQKLFNQISGNKSNYSDAFGKVGIRYNQYNDINRTTQYRVKTDDGTLAYQYNMDASDYVAVKANTKYQINYSYYSSASYGMAFYDSSKTYISGAKMSNVAKSDNDIPFTFTTPANCAFIRFTIEQALTKEITLCEVTSIEMVNSFDQATYTFEKIEKTNESGIQNYLGEMNTGYFAFVHQTVTVTAGEIYKVRGVSYSSGFPMWIVLNSDGKQIAWEDYTRTGSGSTILSERIIIPEGGATLWVNGHSQMTFISIEKAVSNNVSSHWKNKKIVWFGTSVPAGNTGSGGAGAKAYPNLLADMIGATVYNEAIGSSRVRGGSFSDISADDPMGWAGMSAIGVMLSLSLSAGEKQAIADDWDAKWKDIIANPESVDMTQIATYKAASWDSILPKYLTGGSVGQCDAYVFDHGFNDHDITNGYTDLDDVPSDLNDRTYWIGAMHYIIEKIIADNPKAKIIFIGHYNHDGDQTGRGANYDVKYVCEAQEKIATMFGATCIKTWEKLNINMTPITVNGSPTNTLYLRYPDHVHPASDTTGYELQRYAEALRPYFEML